MALQLNTEVRQAIARILHERYLTWAEASRRLEVQQTWLGRRLNGHVTLSLSDVELICSRLDIPITDVLPQGGPTCSKSSQ